MTERVQKLFEQTDKPLLSIFYTAGYPAKDDTRSICKALEDGGVDFIELGIPFSDPLADGPVIQRSSQQAIANGVTVPLVLEQLKAIREVSSVPIFLMGYLNPVFQYGFEKFIDDIARAGADGVIFPDLPVIDFERKYRKLFDERGLSNVFLITPQTSEERIRKLDELSNGFLYVVSSPSITGSNLDFTEQRDAYLKRVAGYSLKNPLVVGFGISDRESFQSVTKYAAGAIVGSAFIRHLEANGPDPDRIRKFISSFRGE